MARCPVRPAAVRRVALLIIALEAARLVINLLDGGFLGLAAGGTNHCVGQTALTALVAHRRSREAEPHGATGVCSGNTSAPQQCTCGAEPGWPAAQAHSWTSAPCGAGTTAGVRRRHCGASASRAVWDAQHRPQTSECVPLSVRADDVMILVASLRRSERSTVGGCTPFRDTGAPGRNASAESGLPNGGRCVLEPLAALSSLPWESFDAAIFDAPNLPQLPGALLDEHGVANLKPLHGSSLVGVMSLEPTSYVPLASEGCRRQRGVEIDLRPGLSATVPLPEFSWQLHPLDLHVPGAATDTFPRDKVPGMRPPALASDSRQPTAAVVWIASNCRAQNLRRELVAALRKHIAVDSIGDCDRTAPWPRHVCNAELQSKGAMGSGCADSKGEALRRYRYYLAFENTNEEGYVTEKVYDALDAAIVPIYFGAPDLRLYVPSGSTLDAHEVAPASYDALIASGGGKGDVEAVAAALAERIKAMENSAEEYDKMHAWRRRFSSREACMADDDCMGRLAFVSESSNCRLCAAVYGARAQAKPVEGQERPVVWDRAKQRLTYGE